MVQYKIVIKSDFFKNFNDYFYESHINFEIHIHFSIIQENNSLDYKQSLINIYKESAQLDMCIKHYE